MNPDIDLPLAGIRILDLTRLLPGPVASMHLADMGAEVIKIEGPDGGDYARMLGPVRNEVSQFFIAVNRGKQLLTLDLKQADDHARFLSMVDGADVLIESFRPGVMARLGLGWDVLKARRPGLVMCAISGYGQSGPFAHRAGHDINYAGYAGVLEQTAGDDGAPTLSNLQVGDLLGGALSAVQGILAALLAVRMGGPGRFVDISMTDATFAHNIMPAVAVNHAGMPAVPGRDLLTGGVPCYNVYRTSDARFMAVGALEYKFWATCCDVLQRPDLAAHHWERGQEIGGADAMAVRDELAALFAARPLDHWRAAFDAVDCCVTPILRMDEAMAHPLFVARGMVSRQTHPGEGAATALGPSVKFTA